MLAAPPATNVIQPGRSAQPLLPLKLTPSPLRDGVLLRPDLQALLAEVRLHPITQVVAPAGYGKTTLLLQWAQELNRTGAPVCWLTLDRGERDPAMFLAYLIRAFQTIAPTLGAEAWRVLSSAANLQRDWPLVAGALCSDLQRRLGTAAFLVLDDLHQIADSAVIGQILGYLLRAAPPTLHIVIASRRAPAFAPLPRLRTEGHLLEITQRDLHLNAEEARQLLAAQKVALDEGMLALLLARTEGWALSIQLAARALAGRPSEERGDFLRALAGSQEQMLDYLATEVLAELPAELIEFLRLAALPERFDAELLADVLGRDEVPYLLGRAQALGLPILPLDEHGSQIRFHPLWRELLLRSDQRRKTKDEGSQSDGASSFVLRPQMIGAYREPSCTGASAARSRRAATSKRRLGTTLALARPTSWRARCGSTPGHCSSRRTATACAAGSSSSRPNCGPATPSCCTCGATARAPRTPSRRLGRSSAQPTATARMISQSASCARWPTWPRCSTSRASLRTSSLPACARCVRPTACATLGHAGPRWWRRQPCSRRRAARWRRCAWRAKPQASHSRRPGTGSWP
jgi:hypothetical protein